MMWCGPPQPSKVVLPHDHLHRALHLGLFALSAARPAQVAVARKTLLGWIATGLQLAFTGAGHGYLGVTEAEALDDTEVPAAFVAFTVNV